MHRFFPFHKLQGAQKATVLLTVVCMALLVYRWQDIVPSAARASLPAAALPLASAQAERTEAPVQPYQPLEISVPAQDVWFVQAGVFAQADAAEKECQALQVRGISAGVCQDTGGYRVLCGGYLQRGDAEAAAAAMPVEVYVKTVSRPQLRFVLQGEAGAGETVGDYVAYYAALPQPWETAPERAEAAATALATAAQLQQISQAGDGRFLQDIAQDLQQFAAWLQDETLDDMQVRCRILFTVAQTCRRYA